MSVLVFLILMGFPTVGVLTAWVAALRSWRPARSRTPAGSDIREGRGRMIPFVVMPSILILFWLVPSLLVLGEMVPDNLAQPAGLAYGVPGLLAGLGIAIIYRRGIPAAAGSKQGFERVLPLAVMPVTSAVFGLVASIVLIGGGLNPTGVMPFGLDLAWLASLLAMVGGIGGLLSAWLAASAWDFEAVMTWPRALTRSSWGGRFTAACLALAMAVLGEWLIVLLMVAYFGATLALGLALFRRARRNRLQGVKPS